MRTDADPGEEVGGEVFTFSRLARCCMSFLSWIASMSRSFILGVSATALPAPRTQVSCVRRRTWHASSNQLHTAWWRQNVLEARRRVGGGVAAGVSENSPGWYSSGQGQIWCEVG
jgi:hypothetical protein